MNTRKRIAITTTRDRPFCFHILEAWMKCQTVQPDVWIVVNDSEDPSEYEYTQNQIVVTRTDEDLTDEEKALPSICKNWLAAIEVLGKPDPWTRIFVMEDDDYYSPWCLQTLDDLIEKTRAPLVGISKDVYYKLPTKKFQRMHNENHASLACTAFTADMLPQVERCCRVFKSVFIDMFLWAEQGGVHPGPKSLLPQNHDGEMLHVGMKGMPGAAGLGQGHNLQEGSNDPNFKVLREWVGQPAYELYRDVWHEFFSKPGTSAGGYSCTGGERSGTR